MIEADEIYLLRLIFLFQMKSTNIYIPNFSDSFKMVKLDSQELLDPWKAETTESSRNPDNLPYGIWDWSKYNKNYVDLLEELGVSRMTTEQIYSEFSEKYRDDDYTTSEIDQYLEEFGDKQITDNENKDDLLELKWRIIYAF